MKASHEVAEELQELVDEVTDRLAAGHPVDFDALVRDHPQHSQRLRTLIPAMRGMAQLSHETAPAADSDDLPRMTPRELGDFRILRELGRGGMGIVYEAEQLSLGRRVALKVLPFAGIWDDRQLQRFRNEARAAATLDHPGIVSVHSVGCERGVHYYAMQLIEGQSLAEVIAALRHPDSAGPVDGGILSVADSSRQGPSSVRSGSAIDDASDTPDNKEDLADGRARSAATGEAPPTKSARGPQAEISTVHSTNQTELFRAVARLGVQAAEALEYAHQHGVIHRDIKPGNLLINTLGKLWVADFGLARIEGDVSVTMTGDLVGTYRYMAPERLLDQRAVVDHRADMYSLGATIYELLTLRPAFPSENREELLQQIAHEEPRAPRRIQRAIPPDLETIVLKAMRKDPAERYTTSQALVNDLKRFLANEPIRARRPTIVDRATKWSQRHTVVVWSTVALMLMAVIALSMSTVSISRAKLETQLANEELAVRAYAQQIAHASLALVHDDTAQAKQSLAACAPGLRGWEWAHMNLLSDLSQRTLAGSWTVAFSPDGKTLVTGGPEPCGAVLQGTDEPSSDGSSEARCWDSITGELLWKKEVDILWSLAYSPDGKLVAAGLGHQVALWDATTGRTVHPLAASTWYIVFALAFDPSGNTFAFCDNRQLKMSDAKTGQVLWSQTAHEGKTSSVSYRPDGRQIATAGQDKTIKIWDAATGDPLTTLTGHEGDVTCAVFSPDGEHIASASADRTVKVWDVTSGETLMTLEGHRDAVRAVTFSPDGRRLASVGGDATLRFWDAISGKELLAVHGHTDEARKVAYSPDGQTVATAGRDGTVKIWNAHVGQPQLRLSGHGQWPVVVGRGITKRVLNAQDNQTKLAFSSDGKRIVSGAAKDAIRLWNRRTGEELLNICDVSGDVLPVAFLAEDQRIVAGCSDGTLRVWDALDGVRLHTWNVHEGPIRAISVSSDGKWVATGSDDKTIKIWDVVAAHERWTLSGHEGIVSSVAFSPDERKVISGSEDQTVRVWDAQNGKPLLRLTGHENDVQTVAFSYDSKRVVSGSLDQTLRIWDAETGQLLRTLLGHKSGVTSASFSPDGKRLVSASLDETVKVWHADTGQELATLRPQQASTAGAAGREVFSVVFSPQGNTLAAGVDDGTIQLWESARPLKGYRTRHTVQAAREIVDGLAQEYEYYREMIEPLRDDETVEAEIKGVALRIATVRKLPCGSLRRLAEIKYSEKRWEEALADLSEAIQLDPTSSETYHTRGVVYRGMGDLNKALAELTEAIRLEPNDAIYHADRAMAHYSTGDLDAAIADFTEAIRLEPEFDVAYANRAAFHRKKGDLDKALMDYNEAIRLKPLAPFFKQRGDVHAERNLEKAIADYSEAIRLDPSPVIYHIRALLYFRTGKLDRALAGMTEAIRLEPNPICYSCRGHVRNSAGDVDGAIADMTEAIRLDPKAQYYTERGNFFQSHGDFDAAMADYNEAIRLDPKSVFAHNSRGGLYSRLHDLEKALVDVSEAIRLDPKRAILRTNRGNYHRSAGNFDKALADYDVAIELDPKSARAYGNRGRTYLKKGELESALADLNEAIRLEAKYAAAYFFRAVAQFQLGQEVAAQRDVDLAAAMTPAEQVPVFPATLQAELAWFLATSPHAELRRVERAVQLAQAVVEKSPQWGTHWRTLGVARYRAGDWDGAREALEKSLQLCSDRQRITATFFLAMTHWQMDDKSRARTLYDQAVESTDALHGYKDELHRFRAEAAQLMELDSETATQDS